MSRLPVIVGFGGINAAGRSSAHHAYRRLVIDKLDSKRADETFASLAEIMQLDSTIGPEQKQYILNHTLIRKLESNLFDPAAIRLNKSAKLMATANGPVSFTIRRNQLPELVPSTWKVEPVESSMVMVTIGNDLDVLFPDVRTSKVNSAGQLPTGFEPEKLYQSRSHPRGLQLTVYGASDAVNSLGIDWETVRAKVPADQISVYASSAMGQLDTNGTGGMLQASLMGKRVSSKNCALGLAEMTADFINAYILGSVGCTGANIGACATFLYNLRQGIQDIRSGKFRAVIVGASEAPLTPEVIEGYRTMGALAEDEGLKKLDNISDGEPNYRRACRPFSDNCGFTLSEASQFIILFDDELAMELGATIYGSVGDVFINADGFKKSIPGPGIGNYITMGKALGLIRSVVGEQAMKGRTWVQAHGTGTPQNRVTESHIFNELAKSFGIENWPVAAIKSYLGHSLGTAAGDQLAATLGVWAHGLIPAINTIDHLADDVHSSHLDFLLEHREVAPDAMDAALINSKGFGGNNSTAAILAPHVTRTMLEKKYGKTAMTKHANLNEGVQEKSAQYDSDTIAGKNSLIYNFGVNVVEGTELDITSNSIIIPGYELPISLDVSNPYDDME
ncbi:MAG: beta-ketoacyl synthase [Pseudomonadales bacterium]